MIPFQEEVYQLTKKLVEHPSIVGTFGERDIAYLIYEILQEVPYFREHPDFLRMTPTRHDECERYNVMALVKAGRENTRETVILMGHMDTVDVEDYGKWINLAFSPEELVKEWNRSNLPKDVKKDLETGDYLGGRGVLDMKSGIAIHLAIVRYFALNRHLLQGNLLFVATCDEERNSRGILSALADILHLGKEENLSYIAAINSDYTSPRYEGDTSRYVYLGTVGKLLPAFYIVGKETHAGQVFEGFDPNLIVSELTSRIDYNTDLCDEMFGEITIPPVSLKQTDLKKQYDVQTPQTAFVYYNFFVHSWSPREVLNKLKQLAIDAFEAAVMKFQARYRLYSELSGHPYEGMLIRPRVYTYEEFYQECREKYGQEFEQKVLQFTRNMINEETIDVRDYARRMVEELWQWGGDAEPVIIIFYASPYIPRVVLNEQDPRDFRLIEAVQKAVQKVEPCQEKEVQVRKFFPYISDMSFVAISDNKHEIEAFEKNMPAWGAKYHMDMEAIRQLDVPVVNIGPYGKAAHKKWERLEVSYSMQWVPNLTVRVIQHLFAPDRKN
ncbi:M20/M25/M40 family metallo-hydrolase [Thermoactinomyces mirandus]|uniref:M20/M25/M40 family metallo-hydrolase n=1 Tax=Thermoactinomyces mirandus TaxID=2756294 RepID=A0A7W1XUU3_9BACL|nr:M20/M25/M40 family metallo-hydrolase [Thermoactinomyces mirandus]MBA4603467.1 M20/M25/M40 family metallo-hydrolase [Thermoactinomyces mirandus]